MKLNKLLLISNKDDKMIDPIKSEWFETYADDGKTIIKMEDT